MKTINIRKTQMKVLCQRLFSNDPFDISLIAEIEEQIGITFPDYIDYIVEIWTPMILHKNRKTYEIQIIVNEQVVSSETFIINR
jgi:hypothetical protein